jgi:guanine deaminase
MSETHYYGAVINPHERNPREPISYSVYPACLIIVSTEGQIVDMITQCDIVDFQEKEKERCNEAVTVILNSDEFLMPGFIDTHTVRCLI